MSELRLQSLRKSYGSREVIRGIDLQVRSGEFMVFVGPSGCGKSTTLRMIAGLESITAGDLLIDGVRCNALAPAQRGVAMVFQNYALYPHMNVGENLEFPLRMAGVPRAQRRGRVAEVAQALGLAGQLRRLPRQLSGGERQRVAIGRAIVRRPKVFLFDEPLSNLDASLRVDMRIELARLHRELGTTMLYVTHDQVEAMTLGERIAVFRDGGIEQVGPPMRLFDSPATEFVASFLGTPQINMLDRPGPQASLAQRQLWQALAGTDRPALCRVGVRPEDLRVGDAREGIAAQLEFVEHLGESSILHLRLPGIDFAWRARVHGDAARALAPGQALGLRPDAARVHGFDSAGLRVALV